MRRILSTGLMASAAAFVLSAQLSAAQALELKIAHFSPATHPISVWLEKWARRMEAQSKGELKFIILPNMQLGPPPKYFDIARTGQADITWFVHGFTPGRFPLTEISNLPYMIGSAEIGAKVLNDPELRKKYLDPEHKGVHPLLLMTHQPGNIHTASKPIRTVEDMKGMRLRFSSATIRDFVAALGGTPVGLPPTQIVEAMQKGTIDGAWIDYGGAATFKIGPVTKYSTEMYSYVTSFCVCMNPRSYDRLPANLKKMIDASFVGVEKEIGDEWDRIDGPGKAELMKAGMTPVKLSKAEDDKFRAVGAKVADAKVAELNGKGLPAGDVYKMIKALAAKHEKTSKTFWTQ
jgi:TRAP-type C4-dicarboxylate transport system substrate-binding protein